MRPPNLNTDTLDLLYEWAPENLPEKERWLDCPPEEIDDRFALIGEDEVLHEHVVTSFGGCWPTISGALTSYDWNAGAPAYLVDLFAEPDVALIPIKLIATTTNQVMSLRAHVG